MQSLTVYIATACLGAMLFFSFVLAPLIFGRLPAQQAGTFAAGVAGIYFGSDGLPTSSLVLAGFVLSLFVLVPAINRAKDRELQGGAIGPRQFKSLHLASVAVHVAGRALAKLLGLRKNSRTAAISGR